MRGTPAPCHTVIIITDCWGIMVMEGTFVYDVSTVVTCYLRDVS